MRKFTRCMSAVVVACVVSFSAHAHRAWIVPSSTVLSGEDSWVTFDASVSNDIFHSDHAPLRLNGVMAFAPDGRELALLNPKTGKLRSTFDLHLQQKGTYKITMAMGGLNARWETEDGERRFWPERGTAPTEEGFKKDVPKKAKNLEIAYASRRVETFVTAGTPDEHVFKPTNKGLEMVPVTHPNDLFSGEKAQFRFLMDGKPAVGTKIMVLPAGMRYRNQQDAIELEADNKGMVSLTWPRAGLYWLSASYSDDKAAKPATSRRGSYAVTFEVLPE